MTIPNYFVEKDGEIVINFMYEPPPPPEFRLYYDENGNVICYTGEKLEGNYIVVDNDTFAQARHDVRVIDGKVIYNSNITQINKLKPSDTGILTSKEDVTLILDDSNEGQYWNQSTLEIIR
jgi:hypothetical protein